MQRITTLIACLLFAALPKLCAAYQPVIYQGTPVPLNSWVYPVCDLLIQKGYLERYATDTFTSGVPLTDLEFAQATVQIFDAWRERSERLDQEYPENPDLSLPGERSSEEYVAASAELDEVLRAAVLLTSEFANYLVPVQVELRSQGYLQYVAHYRSRLSDERTTEQKLNTFPLLYYKDSGETWPDISVPTDHWAYGAADEVAVELGYPPGFFDGSATRTRKEFAVFLARLLDNLDGGRVDGSKYTELASRLRSEFAAELYEVGPWSSAL